MPAKTIKAKTKQMPDELPPEEEAIEEIEPVEQTKAEPWGSQVLRRLHSDAGHLMKDYDEMSGPLEHEEIKAYLENHLGGIEKHMSAVEKMHGKHYKDLPPLEGMEDKDLTEDEAEDIGDELEEETADTEEKDLDTMDDEAVGGSDQSLPEPTAEEATEGMKKEVKALRAKYKSNGKPWEEDEADGQSAKNCKDLTQDEAAAVADDLQEQTADTEEKGLDDRELAGVGEAAGFLKEVSQAQNWDDEMRHKSYHYHKTLEGIATLAEANAKVESGETDVPPAEWEAGAGAKAIKGGKRLNGKPKKR